MMYLMCVDCYVYLPKDCSRKWAFSYNVAYSISSLFEINVFVCMVFVQDILYNTNNDHLKGFDSGDTILKNCLFFWFVHNNEPSTVFYQLSLLQPQQMGYLKKRVQYASFVYYSKLLLKLSLNKNYEY